MTLIYPAGDIPAAGALPVEGPRWPLHRTGGEYRVTDPRGWTWHYAPPRADDVLRQWPLAAITDQLGHRIDIVRDGSGYPVEVSHSGGYRVGVDVEAHRVVGLRLLDTDEVIARFGYDDRGDLTEVVNSSGQPLGYTYDDEGRIIEWADRNGTRYGYTYDGAGRCVATTGTGGCLDGRLDYRPGVTTVVDSQGHATVYRINELIQVESKTDPLGRTTSYTWDRFDRKLSQTDPLMRTTRWRYDDEGNPVEIVRPDGSRTRLSYATAPGRPVRIEDFDGGEWHRDYDERGLLLAEQDPAGAQTRYRYDESGHLAEVVNPLGHATRVETDTAGLPVRVTDPTGAVTSYARDAAGRVVGITDAAGGTSRFGYTVEGRLAWARTADGAVEEWTYDAEGNVRTHTSGAGATTMFEYGPFDLPVARIEPDGTRYGFGYDTELRLTEVTNPLGRVWRYSYDAAGQLVGEVDFNGRALSYRYDGSGEIVAREVGPGARIGYVRDLLGQIVEKHTPDGVTRYAYDPAGRLLRATGPGAELVFQRDPVGRMLAETVNGRTVRSRYNAAGRRVHRSVPGGHDSGWEFDAGGRPSALTVGTHTIRFGYDEAGRETRRDIDEPGSAGLRLRHTWDPAHRLVGLELTAAPEPSTRTPAGQARLVGRGYSYRGDGRLVGINDDLLGHRRLDLDARGRVTAVNGAGWTERYAYDDADNLVHAAWPGAGDGEGSREYDGTILRRAGDVRYEADAAGRTVLRQAGGAGAWRYAWDAEDRLTSVTAADGVTWRYRYDPLGRRLAKERTDGSGHTEFVWDGGQLAAEIQHKPGGPRLRAWDYLPGTFTPVCQTEHDTVRSRFYAVVADPTGTPTELVTPGGEIVWQRLASLWGRSMRTRASDGADCPLRFPGQYLDPETGDHYNYHRYYEPGTARYHSPDPLGLTPAPNPHAYVPNPTVAADPLGLAPYTFARTPSPTHMLKPGEAWHPSQGTPVIGRLPDTSVAATFPGHTKLNASPWTLEKNDAWVQTIVDQKGSVYVGSPTAGNYWNVARAEPSVFAREVQQFLDNGYTWKGDYLVPPP